MSAPPAEPVFAEQWEARAFGLVVHLHERGLFSWERWSEALGAERARRPDGDYYRAWTRALEAVLIEAGIADAAAIDRLTAAWKQAARATPHGSPIELEKAVVTEASTSGHQPPPEP